MYVTAQAQHVVDLGLASLGRGVERPLALAHSGAAGRPHLHSGSHAGRRLLIAVAREQPQVLLGKRSHLGRVPLPSHQYSRCKQVGALEHEHIARHAAHRLPRGVDAIGIEAVLHLHAVDEVEQRVEVGHDGELIVDGDLIKFRSQHKAGMLSLPLGRGPHRGAVALQQRGLHIAAHATGVVHKEHEGILAACVVILRNIQVVAQRDARGRVDIGELLEIVGDKSPHRVHHDRRLARSHDAAPSGLHRQHLRDKCRVDHIELAATLLPCFHAAIAQASFRSLPWLGGLRTIICFHKAHR